MYSPVSFSKISQAVKAVDSPSGWSVAVAKEQRAGAWPVCAGRLVASEYVPRTEAARPTWIRVFWRVVAVELDVEKP